MTNPFLTYGYAGADYFCDRVEETKRLTALLTNGNHVALMSPKRMGKTSLLNHCFAQKEIKDNEEVQALIAKGNENLGVLG